MNSNEVAAVFAAIAGTVRVTPAGRGKLALHTTAKLKNALALYVEKARKGALNAEQAATALAIRDELLTR